MSILLDCRPHFSHNRAHSAYALELRPRCCASSLTLPPVERRTFAYVYLGGGARATIDAVGGAAADDGSSSTLKLVLYGVGAVATLLATSQISKVAGRAIDQAASQSGEGGIDES
eukprot:1175982-Prorocentrum_minimum.AAC.1